MKQDFTQENKLLRIVDVILILAIILTLILFSILSVSGKITKLDKQKYTCNIDPDEQLYERIFMEGDKVTKEHLDSFHKFCLDEFPAIKYFRNNLSKNNTTILWGLENGTEYIVPKGEMWVIIYFGEKESYFNILPMPENKTELSDIQKIEFKEFIGEMFISSSDTPTNSRELLLKDFSCFEANEEDYGMKGYECFFKEVNHSSFAFVSEEQIYDRKIQESELSEIQKIELIAQGIAKSHKYKLNEFDCTDFTKSLVGNLTKEGYEARCIIGYKKQNPKQVFHAWTEVNLSGEIIWIESTTGEIITEENKFYYVPLKGYKRYQCF